MPGSAPIRRLSRLTFLLIVLILLVSSASPGSGVHPSAALRPILAHSSGLRSSGGVSPGIAPGTGRRPAATGFPAGPSPAIGLVNASVGNQYTGDWGGYVMCQARASNSSCAPTGSSTAGVSSVEATWRAPSAVSTESGNQTADTFVGIGGYGSSDLAAVGEAVTIAPNATPSFQAFWVLSPALPVAVSLSPVATISALDSVTSWVHSVHRLPNGTIEWGFAINDTTTSSNWSGVEYCYPSQCRESTFDSAEWIESSPVAHGKATLLPAFQEFNFLGEYSTNGSAWEDPYNGITVYLQNSSASLGDLVLPSGLGSIGFGGSQWWMSYLFDTIDPIFRGKCCSILPGAAGVGQFLNGTVQLQTRDGFTANTVDAISLALELYHGASTCYDPAAAIPVSAGQSGTASYNVSLQVCAGLSSGSYSLQFLVYYAPAGVAPGQPGSLELESSGSQFGSISVLDYAVPAPSTSSPNNTLDLGQNLTLWDNVTAAGNLTGPFQFYFPGAPTGCQTSVFSTTLSVEYGCKPQNTGNFSVHARMVVNGAVVETSAKTTAISIVSPPTVSLAVNTTRVEFNNSFVLYANATGGAGSYQYDYSGLPIGCQSEDQSTLYCLPVLYGNYSIEVNVTDLAGYQVTSQTIEVQIALPFVAVVLAKYSTVPVDFNFQFVGAAVGGFSPYSYFWTGLPTGCASVDRATLNCSATQNGQFFVRLHVRDAAGLNHSSNAWEINTTGGAQPLVPSGNGATILVLALGVIAIVVVVVVVLLVVRRRKPRP